MVSDLAILKFLYKYGPEASWILNDEIHKKANEEKAKKHVIFFHYLRAEKIRETYTGSIK